MYTLIVLYIVGIYFMALNLCHPWYEKEAFTFGDRLGFIILWPIFTLVGFLINLILYPLENWREKC